MSTRSPRVPAPQALLSLRAAVILTIAGVLGVVVGLLTFWAQGTVALAVLAGFTTTGSALLPLHKVIGR